MLHHQAARLVSFVRLAILLLTSTCAVVSATASPLAQLVEQNPQRQWYGRASAPGSAPGTPAPLQAPPIVPPSQPWPQYGSYGQTGPIGPNGALGPNAPGGYVPPPVMLPPGLAPNPATADPSSSSVPPGAPLVPPDSAALSAPVFPSQPPLMDAEALTQHLRIRVGPAWYFVTPNGARDDSQTKLQLDLDYGHKLLDRSTIAIRLIVPVSLRFNTKSFYDNSFFATMVGFQFEMHIFGRLWTYAHLSGGLGTGFARFGSSSMQEAPPSPSSGENGAPSQGAAQRNEPVQSVSQTGFATQMGAGVQVRFSRFDISLEPISIPTFTAFGPGSRGTFTSWNMSLGISVGF